MIARDSGRSHFEFDAAIVGGGPSGLAAALFCGRRGYRIALIEPDPAHGGTLANAEASWRRPGAPHARQGHVLLARATEVLRAEAPELITSVVAGGALEIKLPLDEASILLCRRLGYESVLRAMVAREPNVTSITASVTELRRSGSDDNVPRVCGLRTDRGDEIEASLIVDASGRRSPIARWLSALNMQPPEETEHACGYLYVTRPYRLVDGARFPATTTPIMARLGYASAAAFPADNRSFALSVVLSARDPLRRRIYEPASFDRFLRALPLIEPWIACGVATGDPQPWPHITNARRRLSCNGAMIASGIVLLGDSALHTSPTFGRGVSLAFVHAQHLAERLGDALERPLAFASSFDTWTAENLGPWFDFQLAADAGIDAELDAALRGDEPPRSHALFARLFNALTVLSRDDESIAGTLLSAQHLLISPRALLGDRRLLRQVNNLLRCGEPVAAPLDRGPDRATFEKLLGLSAA